MVLHSTIREEAELLTGSTMSGRKKMDCKTCKLKSTFVLKSTGLYSFFSLLISTQ